jgi:hypothetical protein
MADQTPLKNVVWITCRSRGSGMCEGKQAEMVSVSTYPQAQGSPKQNSFPSSSGKIARYRCLTCKGTFVIGT